MDNALLVMQIAYSLNNFAHVLDDFCLILFSNHLVQIAIGTELGDDDQVFLLLIEEELSCSNNVFVVERNVHLSFFLTSSLSLLLTVTIFIAYFWLSND